MSFFRSIFNLRSNPFATHVNECVFCNIAKGKQNSIKIASDRHCFAIMDINPLSLGHCLVIPKKHYEKFHAMDKRTVNATAQMVQKVCKAFIHLDYNILQNNGIAAYQTVPHVHFHIIPKRQAVDGLLLDWKRTPINVTDCIKEARRISKSIR